ncbi:MAG TPA: hypothetical protein VFX49_03915 [Chloroflexota bacterium]|nr:hypothetical protein [Chloroflexota bacterium]
MSRPAARAAPSSDARPPGAGESATRRPLVDPRYRFLARFGATILSGGIAAIPMALYHYQAELSLVPQEVWFVGYILAHRWSDALPFPSLRRMSRRTGISTQMLHRYKQSLIEKGFLATIPRHRPSGGRTSNYYDFTGLFRALEELLHRDRRDASWGPSLDDDAGDDSLEEPDPDQRQLTGTVQPASLAPDAPASTGPTLVALPAPGAPDGPRNQIPVRQSHRNEDPPRSAARAARETPERSLRADPRWARVLKALAETISPAAFSAWIAPLEPVLDPPNAPAPPGTPVTLRCASAFHLQQVDRRYRGAIEEALGCPVALIHDNHN